MAVAPRASEYCDCGHAADQHRTDGLCRARSRAYGYPCECRQFDDGRPTPIPTLDDGVPMDFGAALTALRAGDKVSRTGWNGAGMWIAMSPGFDDLPSHKIWSAPIRDHAENHDGSATFRPYLMMLTAQGDFVPWVASQSDVLAEDWEIAP